MFNYLTKPLTRISADSSDPNWSEKVKPNPSAKDLPEDLFTKNAGTIANGLRQHSKDFKQAMQRLQFYINRAGKNLDTAEQSKMEAAKEQLYKLYNKEPPKKDA